MKKCKKLKTHHIYTMGTATCVEEAVELEKSGVDAIVVQELRPDTIVEVSLTRNLFHI